MATDLGTTGEIRIFGGNYAPQDWAYCNGALLTISEYTQLYSVIGTAFGGDGRVNFALPDLRGRIPLHYGQSAGTSERIFSSTFGSETVTLTTNQMPAHNHPMQASTYDAGSLDAGGRVTATTAGDFYTNVDSNKLSEFWEQAVGTVGNNRAHYNMMPYLSVNFIICVNGLYPERP